MDMDEEKLEKALRRLLCEIAIEAKDTRIWTGRERFSERVMAAIAKTPRHEFVLPGDAGYAYVNRPRDIGQGQTISQPYIVAAMTDLLEIGENDRVLEIGAGSGYQTAVLAQLAAQVYSIEIIKSLAESAKQRLKRLGYRNVHIRHGDGHQGWLEEAPFDAIMVTAAPRTIPQALSEQLKIGGRMVIPVGREHETQILHVGVKQEDGRLAISGALPVAFVPMVRERQK